MSSGQAYLIKFSSIFVTKLSWIKACFDEYYELISRAYFHICLHPYTFDMEAEQLFEEIRIIYQFGVLDAVVCIKKCLPFEV